jgi:hypothetical protein
MQRNMGAIERYARVAAGLAAGAAATKLTGWQRKALGAVATAGLATGLSGYCPLNEAVGRGSAHRLWPLDNARPRFIPENIGIV